MPGSRPDGFCFPAAPFVDAYDEEAPRTVVSSAGYLDVEGGSFGIWGDGSDVKVLLYTLAPRDTIRNSACTEFTPTTCQPTDRSIRNIRCVPVQRGNVSVPLLRLFVQVVLDSDEITKCVQYADIVPPPALRDAVSARIAANADEITIFGSNIFSNVEIALEVGSCVVLNFTSVSVKCRLSIPAGTAIGSLLRAAAFVPGQYDPLAFVPIATVVAAPAVESSTSFVPSGTTRITVAGTGFNSESPSSTNTVRVRVGQGAFSDCAIVDSLSNSSALVCDVANSSVLSATSGTIYALVRSFNGLSEERAIGSLGVALPVAAPADGAGGNNIQTTPNVAAIIGGVVGSFLFLLIIIIIVVVVVLRRRRNRDIGNVVDVPKEMASMFNIKSSEIEFVKKIGEGSYGAVYLCNWKDKKVALKKLTSAMISTHVNDFFREAATMTGIAPHKNVVRIYGKPKRGASNRDNSLTILLCSGLCQETNNFSLVMEYLPFGSLDSYSEKATKEGWDPILLHRVVLGIARGMAHLAGEGLVHRDLAARNVLLSGACEPKIRCVLILGLRWLQSSAYARVSKATLV